MMLHLANNTTMTSLKYIDDKAIQPNAVDITVDKINILGNSDFIIDEEQKIHRTKSELKPIFGSSSYKGYWRLKPGIYEAVCENTITIGDNEAGFVITRSTLNRNGVYITSGLYDSGYKGNLHMCLHVTCGDAYIKPGTRIGQFLVFESEMINRYNGDYGEGFNSGSCKTR